MSNLIFRVSAVSAVLVVAAALYLSFGTRETSEISTPPSHEVTVPMSLSEAVAVIRAKTETERTFVGEGIPEVDYPDVDAFVRFETENVEIKERETVVIVEARSMRTVATQAGGISSMTLQFKPELAAEYSLEGFQSHLMGGSMKLSFPEGTAWKGVDHLTFTSYQDRVLTGEISGDVEAIHVSGTGCGMIQDASCYDFFYTGDAKYHVTFSLEMPE